MRTETLPDRPRRRTLVAALTSLAAAALAGPVGLLDSAPASAAITPPQPLLYVDASNTAAIALYESLGFARWDTDVLFRR